MPKPNSKNVCITINYGFYASLKSIKVFLPLGVTVYIILTGCIKTSFKSVVETLVPLISENNPALYDANNLLDRAMNR